MQTGTQKLFSPSALFTGKELCLYGSKHPFIMKSIEQF